MNEITLTIIASAATITLVTVVLVVLLLWVKTKLTPSGTVKIDINNGNKVLDVTPGASLMGALAEEKIFLPSACGGKANCGQCKVRVLEGGGNILPTEVGFFSKKQIKDNWRLGCQVKGISNHNVATFITEFTVKLPEGVHLDFKSGEYIQIDIPQGTFNFSDIDVDPEYRADWEHFKFFDLKCVNPAPTMRAYSMASYPAEGDIIKLNVRIATPPFDRTAPKGSN